MALRSVVARALDKKTTRRPRQKPQRARRSNRLSSSQSTEQSVESTEEDNETGTDENNDGDGGGSEDDEGGEESDDTGQMGNARSAYYVWAIVDRLFAANIQGCIQCGAPAVTDPHEAHGKEGGFRGRVQKEDSRRRAETSSIVG